MNFIKKLIEKMLAPSPKFLWFLYPVTLVFCAFSIILALSTTLSVVLQVLSYITYAIAGLTLGYSVYTVVVFAPKIKQSTVNLINKTNFGKKMLSQYGFRTVVGSSISFIFSIAFVIFNILLAFMLKAYAWYLSLALYYALLVALRGGLLLYHKNKGKKTEKTLQEQKSIQIKKYRTCGILLTVIPLCLIVPLLQIIFLDRAFVYQGWTVIGFAAYAFYKIISCTIHLIKSSKITDLTIKAIRVVGLADALVSIFSLQTALLFAFSSGGNYAIYNALTGGVVLALTVLLGIYLIVSANKIKKQLLNIG
ncbi:MAG: hypothetical protein II988_00565 [Clostridia bacterium]|nr:hypothetical protein [Clostridia bacterium]